MRDDILEQKDQILKWIDENQSKAYMSKQLGCKQETLNRYLIKMGIALSREFAARKNYQTAIYFMQVAYNLTHDDNIKAGLDELVNLSKTN